MPHEFNNQLVVTINEILPWYRTLNNLKKHIERYKDKSTGIKKVQSGGNGREMLIAFDSLPNEIRNMLGDPRKVKHQLELFFKISTDAVKFFQNYQFEDGSYLSTAHQEQYITNASVLQALIGMKNARIHERTSRRLSLKGLYSSLLNDAITFQDTLKVKYQVQHTLPSSEKRFKPALTQFERQGFITCISKKHKNTNSKKVTDEIISLLNNLFAKQLHKPTRTEVAGQYNAFLGGYIEVIDNATGELFDPANFKPLSEASIISWLGKWEHRIGTHAARTGNRQKLIAAYIPHHSMKQPKYSGSILSIDDRQPPFKYDKNNRLWAYMGVDLASGAFTCWVFGKSKEGIILEFYREMVRMYAMWGVPLPAELEAEMSLNSSFTNSFLRPGNMFEHVHIEANNARAKRIESYFGNLRYGLEKTRLGWIPRHSAVREANQFAEEKVPIVPYGDIIKGCKQDIATWNNMPHNKFPEMSRWDYFIKNQNPNLKPTNYKGLLPHIGFKTPSSCNAGIIRFNNTEFLLGDNGVIHTGDKLINCMKRVEGQNIDIYWLNQYESSDVLKALIYIGDQYIGEAIEKPVHHRAKIECTTEDLDNLKLMSSYKSTITAYMSHQKANLERLVIIDSRQLTVNNNFKMPGLEDPIEYTDAPVVVLPDVPDPEDAPVTPSARKSFLDRF